MRAYKVTCSVTVPSGPCNPCTADSDLFLVYPSAYQQIAAGDVQVALAGTPSEVMRLSYTLLQ